MIRIFEKKYHTFIKYILYSGISFFIDVLFFSIFSILLKNYIGDNSILLATILARIISSLVNYFFNRNKVFMNNENNFDIATLVKYYVLVIIQMLTSALVVFSLYKSTGVLEILIKVPVEIIMFCINYVIQKKFIFNRSNYCLIVSSKYKNVLSSIGSVMTTFSLLFQVNGKNLTFNRGNTMMIAYVALVIFLFIFYKNYLGKFKNKITYNIISLIFSLIMVFGYSYDIVHNASLVFGNLSLILFSIMKAVGYYLLFSTTIHLLDYFIISKRVDDTKVLKIWTKFNNHPFLYSFVFIFICYIPYIIAYYPGIINYDAANQIKEVMGIHTRYMDSVVLINPDITITNFNPIFHTLLLGGLFKLGHLLGNVNLGLFLYSVVQLLIVISTFSYSIYYMNKRGMNKYFIIIVLLIYSLIPLFPFYAMTSVKDVIFSSLVLIYIIKMYDMIKCKQGTSQYILFSLLVLLIILFRNNGIYLIVLSLPFICILKKEIRKTILIILVFNVSLYIGYNKVLLPELEIANTSIREMLSVPFQQTARHVKYYSKDINEEDREIIDKVLEYDTLGSRYQTDLSDPVKNKYNKYTTNEELKDYFFVWFKYLLKRPVVYIDATINNIYGYFYPNTSAWYIYSGLNPKLSEAGYDYHYNNLSNLRLVLQGYAEAFPYIPVIGTIANIGMVVWIHILLVGMLIVNKLKKYIVLLLAPLSLILVCVVGPANTYFRYILPCVFSLPVIITFLYNELKNN